ncbi:MAG: enoyl-CoA hydratase-related protein, partial [Ferruginibacter sp.]
MKYSRLLVSVENNICIITINWPEKMNALNSEVLSDLDRVIDEVNEDDNIKSAIITGAGEKAFVAGADISEFLSLNRKEAEEFAKRGQRIFFKIENSKKPIIAAVN